DLFPHVVQHHAALEHDRAQMRRQQRKVMRRQGRQEAIEFSVLHLPAAGGGRSASAVAPASNGNKAGENSCLPIAPLVGVSIQRSKRSNSRNVPNRCAEILASVRWYDQTVNPSRPDYSAALSIGPPGISCAEAR